MSKGIGSKSCVDSDQITRIEADTTSIETKVDTVDSIIDDITVDTSKIDDVAVDGLSGTRNSLAYNIGKINRHFHHREKWFGLAASASGETHTADRIGPSIAPFVLTSGNNAFGSWVQLLGSSDTPVVAGNVYMDASRFLITSSSSTEPFCIQIAVGESADLAALVAAEAMSEVMYVASTNLFDEGIQQVATSNVASGSKVWARCICIGANAQTVSLYFGLHEYEG